MLLSDVNLRISWDNPGAQASQNDCDKKNERSIFRERLLPPPSTTERRLFVNGLRQHDRPPQTNNVVIGFPRERGDSETFTPCCAFAGLC